MVTLDKVLELTEQLSTVDKIRLIERITPQIERDLQVRPKRKSLRGLWRGLNITAENSREIRQEMWRGFPRDDI